MTSDNPTLKGSAHSTDALDFNSLTLKPPTSREVEDDYFKGTNRKSKKKTVKTSERISLKVSTTDQHFWNPERMKSLFPMPLEKQGNMCHENFEEVQCLSLEDFSVFKKSIYRKESPPRNLWKHGDFPGLGDLASGEGHLGYKDGGNGNHPCQMISPRSKRTKMPPPRKPRMQSDVVLVSTHSQTDERKFSIDINSSTPDALLCQKLPKELRGTVMNIISQSYESQNMIALLSCFLYRFMIDIIHKTASMDVLTASDIESIEDFLSNELRGLSYFSLRATRGQSRLQSINSCFNTLFRKFPGLRILPGFSDLESSMENIPLTD